MPIPARTFRAAVLCLAALLPSNACADGIETEHVYGFMIGTDVGTVGEREFQTKTTGRFARDGGRYRAGSQDFELEFVPVENFRIEIGSTFTAHDIRAVPDMADRRQLTWQGVSVDLRYRLLGRESAPFGLTFGVEGQLNRIDEVSGAAVRNVETEFRLAVERDLIPNHVLATLNLIYQPEWTRNLTTGAAEQESTVGAALGAMFRIRPDILVGGEARYLRKYEGIGLEEFSGQAVFIGPTAFFQLSPRSRLTAAWSMQAWGRPAASRAALDLVNFERHQARLVFGVNF
ncbi:hypothetical protein [Bradyrhizobium sp.]|uniref:hypothetical protein n=1 Tax=Bradyrhizobium sp. TaxID=376 RepID=UPI004037DCC5